MITRKEIGHISEELLDQLLAALHPIELGENSDKYHIGYHRAQTDFRRVLESRLNAGKLPDYRPKNEPRARWPW